MLVKHRSELYELQGETMKLKTSQGLLALLIIGLFIPGCGTIDEAKENSPITENITVYGGSVGGVWSLFTEGVSEAVRRENPGTSISAVPGTVAGNVILVDSEKADFAIAESLTARFASEGQPPFEEKHDQIRAVAAVIPENTFQMVAPQKAAFNSIKDIVDGNRGIRYSAGEKGALGDVMSAAIFEAYGLTYEDIEASGGEINFLSGGKTFELMQDSRIDSLGKMVPIPAGDIMEASATIDMKLIDIGQPAIDYLVDTYGVAPHLIKAGSYDFQEEDYLTINTPTILITHESMSDEVVYHVTKSIYNQLDYLYDVHNGFKAVNDTTIIDTGGVELHPGAEKFFKEQGLLNN